jgi:nitrite reductase/ring-hydroxylating ferredoxin subunit
MIKKTKICNKNNLKNFSLNKFIVNDKEILLTFVKDQIYLTDSVCLHMGAPLEKGNLHDDYLQCPWHGCKWNFKNGECLNNSMKLNSYEYVIENDEIFLVE